MSATQMAAASGSTREPEIIATLKTIISEMSGIRPSDIDVDTTFIEMGAESLLMLQASQAITEKVGVKVPFRALMEEYPTLRSLATYIDQKLPPAEPAPVVQPSPAPAPPAVVEVAAPPVVQPPIVSNGTLEQIMAQQLRIMAQQLEVMRARQSRVTAAPVVTQPTTPPANGKLPQAETKTEEQPFVPFRPINKTITSSLTEQQQRYLDALIERVSKRTQKSKQLTQEYRPYFADSREVAGFRSLWKEVLYLIIVEQAIGSKIWDVDGNEYLDITMGFGSLLFGHSPDFVTDALQEQVAQGMQLGPQSHLAGKVAKLLCEITGVERATFCNSGTEAVMTALRLARTVTGRTKIVMFTGSFHGTFDGVLVRAERSADGTLRAVPMAPGVPPSIIQDVMILNYGAPESLEIVQQHAHELAGVLVEPLQSRRPDNRPSEFLQGLRRITEESGAAFIFDEVVSGFRMHPGGAQALFNIKADLVTYGKAAGAGMPIGVIAGKKAYMDAIDGGMWQYGDTSYPRADTTFFVGTFFKHPMVMAAAWAALNHIKNSGPQLQERLNDKTSYLARTLNGYFEQEKIPLRIVHCGSLFRFHHTSDQKYMDLFFYQLLEKGIYVWEGRNCFISTAHTDEDIEFLISKVKETVVDMRAGGFLNDASVATQDNGQKSTAQQLPLTEGQKQLWSVAQLGEQASRAYNESFSMHLRGPLNLPALRRAIQQLVDRHDALRITISRDGEQQLIASSMLVDVSVVELSQANATAIAAWQSEQAQMPFDFVQGPLFRAKVLKVSQDYHVLAMTVHHMIIDGWSFGVLLRELSALYEAECQGVPASLPAAKQFSEYVQWQSQQQHGPEMDTAEAYWLEQYVDSVPVLELPTDRPRPAVQSYNGSRAHLTIDSSLCRELKKVSAQEQSTLFQTLLAGYQLLLHRLTNQDDIVVGIASAGQASVTGDDLIGYCINLLPLRSRMGDDPLFTEYLKRLKRVLSDAADNQIYSLPNLIKKLGLTRDPSRAPLVTVTFNLDRGSSKVPFHDLDAEVVWNSAESSKFDLFLNITEGDGELVFDMDYNSDLFEATTIQRWLCHLRTLLEGIVAQPQRRLSELPLLDQQEQQQQIVEWKRSVTQYPRLSVSELFEAQVERTPNNVAVTFQNEKLTYRELNERANQLAHYLRRRSVGLETLVGVLMERSVEMIVALVGILKAGGAYVPLDPSYPRERLQLMLEDARPRVLLTQSELVSTLPETEAEVLYVSKRGQAPLPDLFISQAPEATREPQQRTNQPAALSDVLISQAPEASREPEQRTNQQAALSDLLISQAPETSREPEQRTNQEAALSDLLISQAPEASREPEQRTNQQAAVSDVLISRAPETSREPEQRTNQQAPLSDVLISQAPEASREPEQRTNQQAALSDVLISQAPEATREPEQRTNQQAALSDVLNSQAPEASREPEQRTNQQAALSDVLISQAPEATQEPEQRTNQQAALSDLLNSQAPEATREPQQRTSQEEGLAPAAENLAYVIYTSGSTGTPKGISIPQSAISRLVCNTNYIDLGPTDVVAQISNFSFDAFTFEIWGALLHGAELSILTNDITLSPLDFAAEIKTRGITTMFLTTALFNVLAREAPATFKTVKHVLTGGEMADPQSFRQVLKLGPPARLAHVYGPTENTTFSTWHLVADVANDAMTVPIGSAISNTELYVLDRNFEPVPLGVPGELFIGGAGLARAYLNRPDLTAAAFIPHRFSSAPGARLYRTGDLVRRLPDGNLEFQGRLDQQVKVRGFRIELAEIEAVLCRHTAVREAIVVAHNDGPNQEKRLIAYVVGDVEAATSELRNYLKEYLPEYMIPAAFVLLEKLPLTSNGKVDRKRLPDPETSRPELNESYAAPRTEAERVLAKIWSEVLRVEQVGIHDNFFELGGDSILNVQIITRARQRGIHLTAKQVFYHQTVAELAAVAGSTPEIKATQDEVTGAVELTPVQQWFFAQDLPEPAHFNMAVMVAMSADIDVAALKGAVTAVIRHHDALRSRYEKQDDGNWRQWCVPLDEQDLPFLEMDLSIAPTIAVRPAIEAASAQWQRHLNLEYGPVLRVVYFKLGPGRGARLLLVVHHLVIDVISWRILLEDLQTAYQQLAAGKAVELRAKSSSYQQWAKQLQAYASSTALQEEVAYWTDERRQRVKPIRVDQKGSNLEHTTRYVTNKLSAELTEALLREVPRAYNTQISEVLLAALAGAYHAWSGERLLSVDVEGHGREALFDEVDLTRTVGWFTSIYPLLLELPHGSNYGERLKGIKEQIRRVKNGGVGYGVLRYLSADKALQRKLAEQPKSQISFNYLGRYDEAVSEMKEAGLFQAATERTGPNRALNGERQYPLQLNSSVVDGSLQMSWEYSTDIHREQTVTQLAAGYLNELEQIIRHCQSTNAGGFTPSDVADFKWTETDLEDLSAAIKKAQGAT